MERQPDGLPYPAESAGARPGTPGRIVVERLRHRADFQRAASARRASSPSFLLQARERKDGETPAPVVRFGFTCSRKVGNSVARNFARRRLREAARLILAARARPGWDYVLVGRPGATAERPFPQLLQDLERAVEKVHQ